MVHQQLNGIQQYHKFVNSQYHIWDNHELGNSQYNHKFCFNPEYYIIAINLGRLSTIIGVIRIIAIDIIRLSTIIGLIRSTIGLIRSTIVLIRSTIVLIRLRTIVLIKSLKIKRLFSHL